MKKGNSTIRIIVAIVISYIVMAIVAGTLQIMGLFDVMFTNFTFMQYMITLVGVLNTIAILALYAKVDKKKPILLGFGLRGKDVLFSVLGIMVTFLTVVSFIWLLDQTGTVVAVFQWENFVTGNFIKLLIIGMVGWFFAALKEEVLARGYFMSNLHRFGIKKMLLVTAFIFMALHFVTAGVDIFKAGSWFLGGIMYGYIYMKSGSLIVATIIHAAHNQMNDIVIHGSEAAFVFLNSTVALSDKLIYEFILSLLIIALTFVFYGKNGWLTPADNLRTLWSQKEGIIEKDSKRHVM